VGKENTVYLYERKRVDRIEFEGGAENSYSVE
jgi:hypothetical protein